MTSTWALGIDRADLSRTTLVETELAELSPGEARLRVDRVGLSANNVTYAVLGDSFRYWEFFPSAAVGLGSEWGLVPLWGFAEVVESTVDGVNVGDRVYGYLPSSGSLTVAPVRVDARGFRDGSEHRAELPSPYNVYALTTGDSAYEQDRENLLILFRPLFFTSFMLADYLTDHEYFGAESLVISSASSKTAYGTAFLLHGQGPRVIGLTSPGNVTFTESLGCYDSVFTYYDVDRLDPHTPTGYVDVAGDDRVRGAVRERVGPNLVYDGSVGLSHQTAGGTQTMTEGVFFAPVQMRKRTQDWGRDGLDDRFAGAWRRFVSTVENWVDIRVGHGSQALRATWLEVVRGQSAPRTGHVIAL
jgi:Protein of unknown function (DUF2855)